MRLAPPPPPPPPPVGEVSSDAPFVEVDVLPIFKGGDAALLDYIAKNTVIQRPQRKKEHRER